MKNLLKNKILWISLLIFMVFSTCCMASNTTPELTDESTDDESVLYVQTDLYSFENEITIDQIVDGNAFIFGDTVTISGEVGGDVFVCANNVTFTDSSYVHGNIFACADTITLNGIAYDLYIYANDFYLGSDAIIARDVRLAATNTNIEGRIKRNAYIATSSLTFPEGSKNLITGNLEYSSVEDLGISEEIAGGAVKFTDNVREENIESKLQSAIVGTLSSLLYTLTVVLLAIWLTPKFVDKSGLLLKKKALISFGVGIISFIALIILPVALILLTQGLASYISLAIIGIFVLALSISSSVFSIAVAKLITTKLHSEKKFLLVLFALLVTLVISLVELIPYVGSPISLLICVIGFGMIVYNLISKKELVDTVKEEK